MAFLVNRLSVLGVLLLFQQVGWLGATTQAHALEVTIMHCERGGQEIKDLASSVFDFVKARQRTKEWRFLQRPEDVSFGFVYDAAERSALKEDAELKELKMVRTPAIPRSYWTFDGFEVRWTPGVEPEASIVRNALMELYPQADIKLVEFDFLDNIITVAICLPDWSTGIKPFLEVNYPDSDAGGLFASRIAFAKPPIPSVELLRACREGNRGSEKDFQICVVSSALPREYTIPKQCLDLGDGDRAFLCGIPNAAVHRTYNLAEQFRDCGGAKTTAEVTSCVARKHLPNSDERALRCMIQGQQTLSTVSKCCDQEPSASRICEPGTEGVRRTLSKLEGAQRCISGARSQAERINCVAKQVIGAEEARVLDCLTRNKASWAAAALCSVTPHLTPEQQILAGCAIKTGAQPHAYAVCAGGQLFSREMDKCFSGGIAVEGGCFGPDNEYRKFLEGYKSVMRSLLGENSDLYKAYEQWINATLTPGSNHEFLKIYNNVLADLKSGGLGENNEVVKGARLISEGVRTVGAWLGL